MTFTPSPQLAHATCQVLEYFALHRPRVGAFRVFRENGPDAQRLVAVWARAVLGISLEALPEAAERWIAERTEIPMPATFAKYARQIDNAEFRNRDRLDLAPQAVAVRAATNRDTLGRLARDAGLTSRETMNLWDDLLRGADNDDARDQIRQGNVSDTEFANALQRILAQRPTKSVA